MLGTIFFESSYEEGAVDREKLTFLTVKKISRSQAKHVSQKDGNEASVINKGRKVINGFQDFWGKQKFESGIENRQKEFVR